MATLCSVVHIQEPQETQNTFRRASGRSKLVRFYSWLPVATIAHLSLRCWLGGSASFRRVSRAEWSYRDDLWHSNAFHCLIMSNCSSWSTH